MWISGNKSLHVVGSKECHSGVKETMTIDSSFQVGKEQSGVVAGAETERKGLLQDEGIALRNC